MDGWEGCVLVRMNDEMRGLGEWVRLPRVKVDR